MADTTGTLGKRMAAGTVWLASQSIVSRLIGFIFTWALANFLLKQEEFGQIALVYSITSFATQLINPGVDNVLLQKQKHLHKWATPAFWLSLLIGVAGMFLMVALGAVVIFIARARGNAAYGDPELLKLISILAIGAPLNGMATVPLVILQERMSFKRMAAVNFGEGFCQQLLTILFAALGFGVYSFVLPMPIVAGFRAYSVWLMARPRIQMSPTIHRWPALISSTRWVLAQRLLATATSQGDYIVIASVLADKVALGLYAHAFLLATQALRMLCDNVGGALLPALNAIQDDLERTREATLRANRVLVALITPLAALQLVLAAPCVHLLYVSTWHAMIPLIQWLSVGPPLFAMAWPFGFLLIATGRFKRGFFLWLMNAVTFFALVVPFTSSMGVKGTAIAVSMWSCIAGLYFATTVFGAVDGVRHYFAAGRGPVLAAVGAAIPGAAIVWLMPSQRILDIVTVITVGPLVLGIYYLIFRILDRATTDLLRTQLSTLLAPAFRLVKGRRPRSQAIG